MPANWVEKGQIMLWQWLVGIGAVVLAGVAFTAIPLAKRWQQHEAAHAVKQFRQQRERLEARFFDLAQSLGKPRGLKWLDCEWIDTVTFARERQSKLLTAFAAVNIRFEAIEGGDMEGVEAVGNIRDASAVFHYQRGRWGTGGRALFNMNPGEVLSRLNERNEQFEPVIVPRALISLSKD